MDLRSGRPQIHDYLSEVHKFSRYSFRFWTRGWQVVEKILKQNKHTPNKTLRHPASGKPTQRKRLASISTQTFNPQPEALQPQALQAL